MVLTKNGISCDLLKNDEVGLELITKSNELFRGTRAEIEIPDKNYTKVSGIDILRRLALVTTCYRNNIEKIPITPSQLEQFLSEEKLDKLDDYSEDLALILYNTEGVNYLEAKSMRESLKRHRVDLGISLWDLYNSNLLIVNAGLERDGGATYGVRPTVLLKLTEVFSSEIFSMDGRHYKFKHASEYGLPGKDELFEPSNLVKEHRNLYLPPKDLRSGLRVLYRKGLSLDVGFGMLAYSLPTNSFVNLAQNLLY